MSIVISFTGDTPQAIRDEALKFFNAAPNTEPARESGTGTTAPALPDDKDALVARAKELGVEGVSKRMSVENLQKAVANAEAAATSSPEPDPDPFDGGTASEPEDEDPFSLDEPEVKPATKEDVRTALVNYQTAVKEKLIEDGETEDAAAKKAMNTARGLLKKVGDADNLGGLDEAKFDKVVKAAEKAKSEL